MISYDKPLETHCFLYPLTSCCTSRLELQRPHCLPVSLAFLKICFRDLSQSHLPLSCLLGTPSHRRLRRFLVPWLLIASLPWAVLPQPIYPPVILLPR